MADKNRNYSGGRFAWEHNGQVAAIVKKAGGGTFKSDVIEAKDSTYNFNRKSIGGITFEPFKCEIGFSMGQPLIDWINASFDAQHMRAAGAIIAADADNTARSRRDYTEALITEVGFPACDAASKDASYFNITFQPEEVVMSDGDGSKLQGNVNTNQKLFLPSNFRFELGSLPCKLVSKIDAFTWKQGVVQDPIGDARIYQYTAGNITVPNLKLTLGMRDFKPWQDWFTDFVIKGNCAQENELSGSLTYLSPNREKELGRVEFQQVGIFSLSEADNEAGKDGLKTFTVELYVEKMRLSITGA